MPDAPESRGDYCPYAPVCQSCPCAGEDDVCFPGERLEAERLRYEQLRKAPPPDLCDGVSVPVDGSFADTLPPCVACKRDVPWDQALLMPCSDVEDGDVTAVGIVHKGGCPGV